MDFDSDEITTLLGAGSEFTGKLVFRGTVRIDGRFSGEIASESILIVGEGAEVKAQIRAGAVIIKGGTVVGDIHAADVVEIHAPGRLKGNITARSLFIDKGVIFEGECAMERRPATGEPAPAPPPPTDAGGQGGDPRPQRAPRKPQEQQ